MIKIFSFLCLSFFFSMSLSAQPVQESPDTGGADGLEAGTFTRISKHQDYGLTVTRLVVDLGESTAVTLEELSEGLFEVVGTNKSDKVKRNITNLSVTDKKGDVVDSGRYVTIDLDFGFDSDTDNAYVYIVTLNEDLGKYTKGAEFIQNGRTIRK